MGNRNDKTLKNKFIKGNINYDIISEEDKNIIKNIPYIDFTYICNNCHKIPKIDIKYNKDNGYIEKLYFNECNTYISIDLNDINHLLRKKNLSSLYEEHFMNIKPILREKYLPFKTKDDLNEYIRVYKSYLKLRDEIKKYNSGDIKKNKVFSLFEDLLLIGLYGLGTEYEYENSIIIKDFLFGKFNRYNSEIILSNKSLLINKGIIYFYNAIKIKHLKKNLYAIQYYNKSNINHFFISKIDNLDDIFFFKEIYTQYYKVDSDANIPNQLKKNFIIFNNTGTDFEDIIMVGKDKYIIIPKVEFNLYIFIFDEKLNKYIINTNNLALEYNEKSTKLHSLKNNNVVVITSYGVLIYEFNQNNNNLKCIKKYKYQNWSESPNIVHELKNGDFIFDFSKKIIYILKLKQLLILIIGLIIVYILIMK